jgi:5-methylcytosine-specific restriction endonuclease McrA
MRALPYRELPDRDLLQLLSELSRREQRSTADLIACIAEVDERRLYLRNGCSSMFAYCVEILGLSEDAAYKRIQAARVVRKHPEAFEYLKDGRLQLYALYRLAPHMTATNAAQLLNAAVGRSTRQIEETIAALRPQTETLPIVHKITAATPPPEQLAAQRVLVDGPEQTHQASEPVFSACAPPRVTPIAQERYSVQITLGKEGHEDLEALRELLSHRIPSGNLNEIAEYTFRLVRRTVEKRKFAATSRPQAPRAHVPKHLRTIPANVRRAVRERDGNQCTFVGENGHRCSERRFLEFDHILPFARTPESTLSNLRLRCRAHNQLAAEQVYGVEFMEAKRNRGSG